MQAGLSIHPPRNSVFDMYEMGRMYVEQEAYVPSVAATLMAMVDVSKENTTSNFKNFSDTLNSISTRNIFQSSAMQTRALKNFSFFDHTTNDRPLRTLYKMLPQNATRIVQGAEGSEKRLSSLGCMSEFSMTVKNLVIKYLEENPIIDPRETVISAGCAAGLDVKSIAVPKASSIFSDVDDVDLEDPNPVENAGPVRAFEIIGTRDLVGPSSSGDFRATRYYNHEVFILPESFENIDLDDTTTPNFIRNIARQCKWFSFNITGTRSTLRWGQITNDGGDDLKVLALDDMVESEILKYLIAMTSGVLIDQDLMFDRTYGFDPSEINIPGFTRQDLDIVNRVEKTMRKPSTGLNANVIEKAFVPQDVSSRRDSEGNPIGKSEDPSHLGKFGAKRSLVIDEDAENLTVSSYRTILDPDTGAEIRQTIKSDAKPWNVRVLSALSNATIYKAKNIPSAMFANPLFDYLLICRVRATDFPSDSSPIDLLSFAVQIKSVTRVENYRKRELPRNGSRPY